MYTRSCILLSLLFLSPCLAVFAESAPERQLWEHAVDSFHRNERWEPGRIEMTFEQFDRRQDPISSYRTVLKVEAGTNGELETTVVETYENGVLVDSDEGTAERRGPPFGEDGGPFSVIMKSPFDPKEQSRVSVRLTDATRVVDGLRAVAYEFRLDGEGKEAAVGTAWLDAMTGQPLAVESTLEPLPSYFKTFDVQQSYSGSDDRWTVEAAVFTAEVSFLLVRRSVESAMLFSEYFHHVE